MAFAKFRVEEAVSCQNLETSEPTWQECVDAVSKYKQFCSDNSLYKLKSYIIEPAELKRVLKLSSEPAFGLNIYPALDKSDDGTADAIQLIAVPAVKSGGWYQDVDVPPTIGDAPHYTSMPAAKRPCPTECGLTKNILNP